MLWTLVSVAISVGILHTLKGPDHYLPLISLAKTRAWSLRHAMILTCLCGLLHCGMAFVLLCIASPIWIESMFGNLAACGMIATGISLTIAAIRARTRPETTVRTRDRSFSWALYLIFALGPCEWLLPAGAAAWNEHGFAGALITSISFALATIATMVTLVAVGMTGLARLSGVPSFQMRVAAGLIVSGCGVMMLAGL